MYSQKAILFFLCFIITITVVAQTTDTTYAERLGFPKGSKVIILHIDDAGMSWDSNEGVMTALTKGAANSTSVMMPCPWVPAFVHYLKEHPQTDAGLHLTLTSEWKAYRWGPLAGKPAVPGLTDTEGDLWPSVRDVVQHASPGEVYTEIKAQLDRALTIGFSPTHLDSHMGTLFGSPAFLQQYIRLGVENRIPVMLPGGNDKLIQDEMHAPDTLVQGLRQLGKILWDAGLPVLDDLHNYSYDWKVPDAIKNDDSKLQAWRTGKYIESFKMLQPGVTMVIMHCTAPSEVFQYISDSGPLRKADMLAMVDPVFKKALNDQHIILTTWRELMERRRQVK
ncbi:ChbG/HpnK family deacetylase [Ilyomonas limi]|uniref:ChbG/HpnK family deacetylase n=1 Tax=Ilyomonas limi TaxID=2575867 RepID=A0A4U3LCT1_9BACT|nr:polysaccharide deacetylase family protein [Ilyomonas limi]TKK71707.1 ChbG/HpnK family deacetylase [Ilyomonas limi]